MRPAENSLAQRVHKMPSFAGRCDGGGAVPKGAGVPTGLLLTGAAATCSTGPPRRKGGGSRPLETRNTQFILLSLNAVNDELVPLVVQVEICMSDCRSNFETLGC